MDFGPNVVLVTFVLAGIMGFFIIVSLFHRWIEFKELKLEIERRARSDSDRRSRTSGSETKKNKIAGNETAGKKTTAVKATTKEN